MTRKNLKMSVLSLFYIAVVLHGLQRICGLFVIELSKNKNITHQEAAIPYIYSWAVSKIVASFSDFLIDNKSSELVVLCGVLLCTIGAALCILDTDITSITVFWGFLFGSGYGIASPHLGRGITNVDSSKLSFFVEIPSSFGISLMPILLNILISQYGLQGSCIIFSGIILQYLPLALAAVYNIEIRFPNIKWRVCKRNSQYSVSQHQEKASSNESFINSLEPDFISKINQCSDNYHKINGQNPVIFSGEILPAARKRSGATINDLQYLEIDRKMLHKQFIHNRLIHEVKNCEKKGNMVEDSFRSMDVPDVGIECKELENLSVLNSDVTHNISTTDKNILSISKHNLDSKNKLLKSISCNKVTEAEDEKKELENQCHVKNTLNNKSVLAHTSIESVASSIIDKGKDCNIYPISVSPEVEQEITFASKQTESSLSSHKFHQKELLDKETPLLSPHSVQSTPIFTIPLDIKVHVEEYILTVHGECRNSSLESNYSEGGINSESNYSQARFFEENEFLNSPCQNASTISKYFDNEFNLSSIYSASNSPKINNRELSEEKNNKAIDLNISKDRLRRKFIKNLKFLNKITSPICLCIVAITIIFEISLIILLINIGDIKNNTDRSCFEVQWILTTFGIGGLFGKFCCCKISRTISEKTHTVGVILFLLTGLSIAGVLYSPNMIWLAGFYSILGALEGGISYILPKFVSDYTHKEMHHMISSLKTFLSGTSIICLPYVTGLVPDEMGDYEFLLQVLSCSLVLCAFLSYFLPHLRSIPDKRLSLQFKDKIDRV